MAAQGFYREAGGIQRLRELGGRAEAWFGPDGSGAQAASPEPGGGLAEGLVARAGLGSLSLRI